MPSLSRLQIPPPQNWQDFEELCCDLWGRIWGDPNAQQNGRQGQAQHGVDVFGRPGNGTVWAAVQCKLKSELTGSKLERGEIEAEVKKTGDFDQPLASFTLATTAARDAKTQKAARDITEKQIERGSFPVTVASWDDILLKLTDYPDLVKKHYPDFSLEDVGPTEAARDEYLLSLWERLFPLPLLGVGREGSRTQDVPLASVYTALDVTAEIQTGGPAPGGGARPGFIHLSGDGAYLERLFQRVFEEAMAEADEGSQVPNYRRRCTALEAAAAARRLVLIGPAGSGKTTFVRYLALSLAGEMLGREEANLSHLDSADGSDESQWRAWPHGTPLPIFVELRKLVRHEAFQEGDKGTARHLTTYLESCGEEKQDVGRLLPAAFAQEGGALLILDGLDETPAAEASRERLKQVIAAFTCLYPNCRVLLTCRPYAYVKDSAWRLDAEGFEEASLADFDDSKIQAFVEGWYGLLTQRRQVDDEQAARGTAHLVREIGASPYLKPLARRPLMLTMMTDLHASSGGRLPGGRAGLYERSVELLLDRWNKMRDVLDGQTLAEHLGMTSGQLRLSLEGLAYRVHRQRGAASGSEPAEIEAAELWQALDAQRDASLETRVDERQVMDYLHQRAGILIGESSTLYRFPHRSYQEFLAACHLVRTEFPPLLLREVEADPALWREVVLLAVGKVAETPFMAWALLEGLTLTEPEAEVARDDPRFLPALYAALAVQENELWRGIQPQDAGKLERIHCWLEASLKVGALSPADRAAGGRVLGLLGDRRKGVGLSEDGAPDVDWVEIPAGKFLLGSSDSDKLASGDETPQNEIDLQTFHIGRYPVTNAQYGAFVADGGYTKEHRHCWTDAGWKWKEDREGPDDDLEPEFLLSNHPRVNVTWHEVCAFCNWLGEGLERDVRLPTEAEWEKAARGTEGRIYPWGDAFDAARCNSGETGIGKPSAVGAFPSGASPYGVFDTSGNVWEWTLSRTEFPLKGYAKGLKVDPDGDVSAILAASGAARVVRGGSYRFVADGVRSAFRDWDRRHVARFDLGFRVVFLPPRASRD